MKTIVDHEETFTVITDSFLTDLLQIEFHNHRVVSDLEYIIGSDETNLRAEGIWDLVLDAMGVPPEVESGFSRDWLYEKWFELKEQSLQSAYPIPTEKLQGLINWIREEMKQATASPPKPPQGASEPPNPYPAAP